jgi:hypothetical protein
MFIPIALAALLQSASTPPAATPSPAPGSVQEAAPGQERKEKDAPRPSKGLRKKLKATLGAIDVDAMTIAFRDESGRGYTWPVNQRVAVMSPIRATQALKTLVPGDDVWILYTDDDGPATIIDVRRVKPKPPAGDDRPRD